MNMKKYLLFLVLISSFLLSGLTSLETFAQTKKITGTVKDEFGELLIGVTVLQKNTQDNGTVSDFNGEFTLMLQDSLPAILKVSYIGFVAQEIDVTNQSHINIILKEENLLLEEVIVVGYGVQSKMSLTGAVAGVMVSDIKSKENKKATTWKRSGMSDNSIRLQVGAEDFIPLEAAQMAVSIDGFRVRVLMDCFFYNNKGDGLEGTFKLKLPTDATPFYFAFGETEYLDEEEDDKKKAKQIPFNQYNAEAFNFLYQEIEDQGREWDRVKAARIVSKQLAARAYEQTVSANIDPALMEWGGADMFSCRVFPLSNNTLHRIVIGYDLNMTEALYFREYILSLPKTESDFKLDMAVFDSPGMNVEIPKELTPTTKVGNRTYYSLSNPKKKEFVIRYNNIAPVMLLQASEESQMMEGGDGNGYEYKEEKIDIPYFAANYRIDLPETKQENLPSDAVFLLDVSISSNPDKFNVWLKLMAEILDKNKDIIKRFAVLTFNIDTKWYDPYFQRNNFYNREKFFEYANTLALEGATNLASALQEASNPSWEKKGKESPKHIFVMSDADCNWGETNMHTFKKMIRKGDRIHTYKTGLSGTNTTILNYLSNVSGGFAFTVTGEEEAELTAKSFRYKPWTIENISVEGVSDFLISGQPCQLYNGQKLIFTGRGIPTGNITINVNNGSEKRTLSYAANEQINSNLVSRIYGQVAASYLESYGYKAEEAAINYSTYYQMPGQYTSFLMLESESDYYEYGIDNSSAEDFVEENLVTAITTALDSLGTTELLGNAKADFLRWMEKLSESDVNLSQSEEFKQYIAGIPEGKFEIFLKERTYRLFFSEQQTDREKELIADDDIRFDNLYKEVTGRKSAFGSADALKLLSSVVEKNAADVQVIRDVALKAIEWGMGDQAYFLMRRIIDWREGEALAYATAADALAKAEFVDMALIYYYITLNCDWDSDYGSIKTITAFQCLRYLNRLSDSTVYTITPETKAFISYLKNEVCELLESEGFEDADNADIIVVVSWNINNTDIDLHVMEPTGEICYYGNSETEIGGRLSIDVTDGYGPEMYVLKNAVPGEYAIGLDYYRDSGTQTASKAKAYIDIYRNWGQKNEKVTHKVIQLRSGDWDDYDEDEDKRNTVMKFKIK